MRRHYFHVRIIEQWNSSTGRAIMQHALPSFKRELVKDLGDLLHPVL